MSKEPLQNFLAFTIETAKEAGKLITSHLNNDLKIEYKAKRDIVTIADKKSEDLIINRIKDKYPNHFILSEEGTQTSKEKTGYRWIIDPIDGTTNYAHGHSFFCVSIGLEIKGELSLGVVYAPLLNELYTATKGFGSYLNHKRISVSKISSLTDSLLATGFNPRCDIQNIKNFEHFLPITQGIRRAGSAALDLCYVAAGKLDGYWEKGLKPWDMAAGAIILTEAGGKITSLNGSNFDIDGNELLATNGLIHQYMADHFNKYPLIKINSI